jgi:hypothetical protein
LQFLTLLREQAEILEFYFSQIRDFLLFSI